jgi:hypothetical protein
MELKCKELKTSLLLFLFDNPKFKSIPNYWNPLNKWIIQIPLKNVAIHSMENKHFSLLLHLKFNTKKTDSIQIKTYSIEKRLQWILKWKMNGEKNYRVGSNKKLLQRDNNRFYTCIVTWKIPMIFFITCQIWFFFN